MTGTLINVAAVLSGTAVGLALGGRLPGSLQQIVLRWLGLITVVIGIDLALAWGREGATADTPLIVLGGILVGGLIGEWVGIDRRLAALGDAIQRRVSRRDDSRVAEGFVTASLLFCVGSLAVVGSIQDGLTGDYQTLATKATLDGFASIALAAALGWGVGLSGVSILIYQGAITLAAGLFEDILVGEALAALTSAGGITIVGIGLKLLDMVDVRVANLLPALVVAPALVGLVGLV